MNNFFVLDKSYKLIMDKIGINPELIFKKAGIPYRLETEESMGINKKQYISLMETMDMYTKDEHILMMNDVDKIVMFVPPLFAAMCSNNGINCFERISTYKKLMGPFELNVTKSNENLNLEFIFNDNILQIPRFTILSEQVFLIGIVRKATGLNIIPTKVGSIYDYGDGKLEKYFGIKPVKIENNILSFSIKDMKEPFLTSNNVMLNYLEPELKKRMKELEIDETFSAKVRSKLFKLIPAGKANIETVARELSISPRTLQRRLFKEKTTFIKELNYIRELMARNYIKDPRLTIDEISYLVGYSDAKAFGRAFRSWTGMTVTSYRKKIKV